MTTTVGQSHTDAPFADCSIAFLLPRTLGSSFSAGAATSETEDQDLVANLLKTTALKNFSQVLENAKMIGNSSFSSIPNVSSEEENAISAKRSHESLIELQPKRVRQRRPSLTGVERRGNIFNFSAKPAASEVSQVGAFDLSGRANCAKSNSVADSQSWPVIDYSCLENITDPMEYFSTYRMLENAEKEVKKLKGEAAPRPSQPQSRRDRQRRPGLSEFKGMKHEFKFQSNIATMEASRMENSSLSNDLNISELNIASCLRKISQTENSRTVEPESEFDVNAKTCDSDVGEIDELERLLSQCRELNTDESGIASFVRDTLRINPIYVKSKGLPVDAIHFDPSSPNTQNACIPLFSNGKQPSSEDEVHSPADEILEVDKNNCKENASDSKGRQISLFEKETWQRSGGIICDKNLVPDTNFEEIGTDVPEPLYSEIPKDQCLPKDPTLMDEQMEAPSIVLNGKNKDQTASVPSPARRMPAEANRKQREDVVRPRNHGHSDASGGLGKRKLTRQEPTRRQIRQNSILRRKSLEGAGTEWKTGVRRSTRIRMKPLQYWCGERFLYGRVHDSLATVIGVKKFETPQRGRTAVMKVKSYVPEKYADLVALVALH